MNKNDIEKLRNDGTVTSISLCKYVDCFIDIERKGQKIQHQITVQTYDSYYEKEIGGGILASGKNIYTKRIK